MPKAKLVTTSFDRPNLSFEVIAVPGEDEKKKLLVTLLKKLKRPGIVYCATVKTVEQLGEELSRHGIPVVTYHGRMNKNERDAMQTRFMEKRSKLVMVATNAFGLGVDKPDIRYVIHYHVPGSLEQYAQEAGRGGRDGLPARCVLLFSPDDVAIQEHFLKGTYPTRRQVMSTVESLEAYNNEKRKPTLAELAMGSHVGLARTRTVLALLKDEGWVIEERGGHFHLSDPPPERDAVRDRAREYEKRRVADRRRLDALLEYVRVPTCRNAVILAYSARRRSPARPTSAAGATTTSGRRPRHAPRRPRPRHSRRCSSAPASRPKARPTRRGGARAAAASPEGRAHAGHLARRAESPPRGVAEAGRTGAASRRDARRRGRPDRAHRRRARRGRRRVVGRDHRAQAEEAGGSSAHAATAGAGPPRSSWSQASSPSRRGGQAAVSAPPPAADGTPRVRKPMACAAAGGLHLAGAGAPRASMANPAGTAGPAARAEACDRGDGGHRGVARARAGPAAGEQLPASGRASGVVAKPWPRPRHAARTPPTGPIIEYVRRPMKIAVAPVASATPQDASGGRRNKKRGNRVGPFAGPRPGGGPPPPRPATPSHGHPPAHGPTPTAAHPAAAAGNHGPPGTPGLPGQGKRRRRRRRRGGGAMAGAPGATGAPGAPGSSPARSRSRRRRASGCPATRRAPTGRRLQGRRPAVQRRVRRERRACRDRANVDGRRRRRRGGPWQGQGMPQQPAARGRTALRRRRVVTAGARRRRRRRRAPAPARHRRPGASRATADRATIRTRSSGRA
jgi:superfamily II DNA/RNA helicase